jgi:negative regulator of genetic competence, sporulation and motility
MNLKKYKIINYAIQSPTTFGYLGLFPQDFLKVSPDFNSLLQLIDWCHEKKIRLNHDQNTYVDKIGNHKYKSRNKDNEEEEEIEIMNVDEEEEIKIMNIIEKNYKKNAGKKEIYEFKNLDDVCSLCRHLHNIYTGNSSLFKHSSNYYLLLTRNSLNVTNSKLFELLLSEYGQKAQNIAFLEGYLNEYGTMMIEYDAMEVLNRFF